MNDYKLPLPRNKPPLFLESADWAIRAQKMEDAEKDYATVMSARNHLRTWCGDSWPEDSFSLEENKEDLAGHIEDASKGFAFGYTVWSSGMDEVLGSVYLYPAAYFAERYNLSELKREHMRTAGVLIDYWLKAELEASSGHAPFIEAVKDWLRDEWGFQATVWPSRPGMIARRKLYEQLGMLSLGEAESLHTPGWRQHFHIWEDNSR